MMCHNGATWHGNSLPLQYRIPDGFMVEASREVHDRLMTGMKGASMARPVSKSGADVPGQLRHFVVWSSRPMEVHWATHNTNLEDAMKSSWRDSSNLACGNTPIYATANRVYFKVGGGSTRTGAGIFEFMRRVETVHKDSVPVPYVSIVPTWEALQLWRTRQDKLELADHEPGHGPCHAG